MKLKIVLNSDDAMDVRDLLGSIWKDIKGTSEAIEQNIFDSEDDTIIGHWQFCEDCKAHCVSDSFTDCECDCDLDWSDS